MAKMRALPVKRAGGSLELVERDVPEPAPGEVRVRVEACGVCHGDSLVGVEAKPIQSLAATTDRREPLRCGSRLWRVNRLASHLAFSTLSNVRPMIETMPLAREAEAYARMMRGEARFRMG